LRRFGLLARGFFSRLGLGFRQGLVSVVVAFLAYIPTYLIGLQQDFWGAITAISVAQREFRDSASTARKQFTGPAIGGAAGLGISLLFGIHRQVYAAALLLSVMLCWALDVTDASQLAAITATIILLVPHTGSAEEMLFSRLSEVG
jgi:uncharacterized membrane protein YgaE (UPF0421/DUF939 family)